MIDVVRAQDCPGELHKQVVLFVGAFGGGEYGQRVRATPVADPSQLTGSPLEGLIPADLSEITVLLQKRLGQPFVTVDELVSVPSFDAESSFVNGVTHGRQDTNDLTVQNLEAQSAPAAAIGASSQNRSVVHGDLA